MITCLNSSSTKREKRWMGLDTSYPGLYHESNSLNTKQDKIMYHTNLKFQTSRFYKRKLKRTIRH